MRRLRREAALASVERLNPRTGEDRGALRRTVWKMRPLAAVLVVAVLLAAAGCASTSTPHSSALRLHPLRVVKTVTLRPGEVRQFSRSMHVTGYDIECTDGTSGIGMVIRPDLWGAGGRSIAQTGSRGVSLTATPKADAQLTFSCKAVSS